jgi:hypothetical protein
MSRLATISPELAERLHRASAAKRHHAIMVACEMAVSKAQTDYAVVEESLRQLRAGHVFTAKQKGRIDTLTAQLDQDYLNLQEAAETGKIPVADFMGAFAKARAVAAVSFAGSDAPDAASESIYEAAAAVGEDKAVLLSRIESALK